MKGLVVILLSFQAISAVMHSWKAFYTGSSGLNNFPEFVALNILDDEVMGYFDSRIDRFESRQSWMKENLGQEYDDRQANILRGNAQSFKANVEIARERFNQSKGVHLYQNMYGCEWDDETEEVKGYDNYGFDGEDLLAWELKTEMWVAPKQEATITKNKWNSDKALLASKKQYYGQICPEWLKKYLDYGKNSLSRKVLPSVSLLQKTSSSPVSCHATGFYPNKAEMFWRKDGVELHEGVNKREILTNNDGTFQMSVDLKPSSVKPEDWEKYDCVFQLSGVNKDIITKLDKAAIRTNEGSSGLLAGLVVVGVIVGLVLLVGAVVVYCKCFKKENKGFKRANTSDNSSSSSSQDSDPTKVITT